MKYLLTRYVSDTSTIEEDLELFDTKDEIARCIVDTRWLTKKTFDSEHFKGSIINPEDCWKRNPEVVRRAKARELIKTMEDLQKTNNYGMLMWEVGYDWYEVEDDYKFIKGGFTRPEDSSLYDALYDPMTGESYMSTIGHVPGYRD